jgi:hypothetical protein
MVLRFVVLQWFVLRSRPNWHYQRGDQGHCDNRHPYLKFHTAAISPAVGGEEGSARRAL